MELIYSLKGYDRFSLYLDIEAKRKIMLVENIINDVLQDDSGLFYGFADLTGHIPEIYEGNDYAIVIGRKLDDVIIDGIKNGPNPVYWNHYKQVNSQLYDLLSQISDELQKEGIPSQIINPTLKDTIIDTKYNDTLRVEFSHKMAATQAGLGWIGKTALFVSREFGTRVRLATLLTPHPLKPTSPAIVKSKCGKCDICVVQCPANAATRDLWDVSVDRDDFFDAFKCRAMCRTLGHKMIGENKRLCGICVAVCPIGR